MQRADQELARLRQALVQAWAEIAELRVLADHDSLTGLANRRRMMAELEDVVEDCRRHGGDASLVFMDLNRLKMLYDIHGHPAGDAASVPVTRIIREPSHVGFAARLGAAQFALASTTLTHAESRASARLAPARTTPHPPSP